VATAIIGCCAAVVACIVCRIIVTIVKDTMNSAAMDIKKPEASSSYRCISSQIRAGLWW
jgi:hypothetical protein